MPVSRPAEGETAKILVESWMELSPVVAVLGAALSFVVLLILSALVLRLFRRRKLSGYAMLLLSLIAVLFCGPIFVHRMLLYGIEPGDSTGKVALTVLILCGSLFVLTAIQNLIESRWFVERLQIRIPGIFLNLLSYIILLIVLVVVTEKVWNTQILAGALTASAAGSVIAGFALKDTLSSFFAGIALVSEQSLRIGDWVRLKEVEGEIVGITWRTVQIRTRDGDLEIVPHAIASMEVLRNYSRPTREHAVHLEVGAAYEHPPSEVKGALLEAVLACDKVLREPDPQVRLVRYNDFSIDYDVKYWLDDFAALPGIKSDVMSNIWYVFKRRGIKIPFPIREITVHQAAGEAVDDGVLQTLKKVPIFAALDESDLVALARASKVREFGDKEYLIRQGAAGDSLFAIVRGIVDVRVEADGTSRSVASLSAGQFAGEMALLTGEARTASVVARSDVVAVEVMKEALAPLLQKKPEILETIARVVALRKEGLDETRAQALADSERRRLAASQGSCLAAIARFFGLPSRQK